MSDTLRIKRYQELALGRLFDDLSRIKAASADFERLISGLAAECGGQMAVLTEANEAKLELTMHLRNLVDAAAAINAQISGAAMAGQNARKAVDEVLQAIDQSIATAEQLSLMVGDMRKELLNVTAFTELITDITERTKIVSINSIIIAHRSSEKGKGFSVIAREIDVLSGKTAIEAVKVRESISRIVANETRLVERIQSSIDEVRTMRSRVLELRDFIAMFDRTVANAAMAENSTRGGIKDLQSLSEKLQASIVALEDSTTRIQVAAARSTGELEAEAGRIGLCVSAVKDTETKALERGAGSSSAFADGTVQGSLVFPDEAIKRPDPALALYTYERNFSDYQHSQLAHYTVKGQITPLLAESWLLEEDQVTWRFKLRKDALFSDGSPVTAADVKFSFERVLHPAMESPHANILTVLEGAAEFIAGESAEISGIVTSGKHEVMFKLRKPYNFFLSMLTQSYAAIVKKNTEYGRKPFPAGVAVGAGPFVHKGYDPEAEADILEANVYKTGGRPYLDRLVIKRKISDAATAYASGELTHFFAAPSSIRTERLLKFESRRVNTLQFNFTRDCLTSRSADLRVAIWHAIDKDRIVRDAYEGKGSVAHTVLQQNILDTGGCVLYGFDRNRARDLIKKAYQETGASREVPIRLAAVQNPRAPYLAKTAALIAEDLQAVGLKVELSIIPQDKASLEVYKTYDVMYLGNTPELDAYLALEPFINPRGGDNFFEFNDPKLLEALDSTLGIRDEAERRAKFMDFLKLSAATAWLIPVAFIQNSIAYRGSLRGTAVHTNEDLRYEDLWLSSNAVGQATGTFESLVSGMCMKLKKLSGSGDELARLSQEVIQEAREQRQSASSMIEHIGQMTAAIVPLSRAAQVSAGSIAASEETSVKGENSAAGILQVLGEANISLKSVSRLAEAFALELRAIDAMMFNMQNTVETIDKVAVMAGILSAKGGQWRPDFIKVSKDIRELSSVSAEEIDKTRVRTGLLHEIIRDMLDRNEQACQSLGIGMNNATKARDALHQVNEYIQKAVRSASEVSGEAGSLEKNGQRLKQGLERIDAASHGIENEGQSLLFGVRLKLALLDELADRTEAVAPILREFDAAVIS